jgi:hypothetical protein
MYTKTEINQIKTIKNELLSTINKTELTCIKEKYGKETIKLFWLNYLSDTEKSKIRFLCDEKNESNLEQSILNLVKMVKQIESSIICKMSQHNYKSLKDEEIKVDLRNRQGKNQLVVTCL